MLRLLRCLLFPCILKDNSREKEIEEQMEADIDVEKRKNTSVSTLVAEPKRKDWCRINAHGRSAFIPPVTISHPTAVINNTVSDPSIPPSTATLQGQAKPEDGVGKNIGFVGDSDSTFWRKFVSGELRKVLADGNCNGRNHVPPTVDNNSNSCSHRQRRGEGHAKPCHRRNLHLVMSPVTEVDFPPAGGKNAPSVLPETGTISASGTASSLKSLLPGGDADTLDVVAADSVQQRKGKNLSDGGTIVARPCNSPTARILAAARERLKEEAAGIQAKKSKSSFGCPNPNIAIRERCIEPQLRLQSTESGHASSPGSHCHCCHPSQQQSSGGSIEPGQLCCHQLRRAKFQPRNFIALPNSEQQLVGKH